MPRLWDATVDAHRREVRDAILSTTAALAAERGLPSVTMSQVASEAGIARATLYRYFPDVEAILIAWHERQIASHLAELAKVRDRSGDARERLHAVLGASALIFHKSRTHGNVELARFLHQDGRVARAEQHLRKLFRNVISDAAKAEVVRGDVSADELAAYCVHALAAARTLSTKAAVRRLVEVTIGGLRAGG